jgi:hypothetical protein
MQRLLAGGVGESMLPQVLLGGGVSICNIVIHALVMTAVVKGHAQGGRQARRTSMLLISVMVATVAPSSALSTAASILFRNL